LAAELASRTARSLTRSRGTWRTAIYRPAPVRPATTKFGELGRALDQLAKNLSRTLGELREERDRLGGILASMQEGVLLLDRSGHIYVLNPSLREMLLVGPDSVGKTVLEVVRHGRAQGAPGSGAALARAVTREIDFGNIQPRRLLVRAALLPGGQAECWRCSWT